MARVKDGSLGRKWLVGMFNDGNTSKLDTDDGGHRTYVKISLKVLNKPEKQRHPEDTGYQALTARPSKIFISGYDWPFSSRPKFKQYGMI